MTNQPEDSAREGVAARGVPVSQKSVRISFSPESVSLVARLEVFYKAFLETLGQHSGESVASPSGRVRELVHARYEKGEPNRVLITVEGGTAIIITADLPDEARLVLLDLASIVQAP